jgi:hypothetical protein
VAAMAAAQGTATVPQQRAAMTAAMTGLVIRAVLRLFIFLAAFRCCLSRCSHSLATNV